jgi:hypothetical protein
MLRKKLIMQKNADKYEIKFPKHMDVFKIGIFEMLMEMTIEETYHYTQQLIWQDEQGCSQAMRND